MSEHIVISGISGRFVESDNLDELWTNLVNNTDMVTDDDRRFPKNLFQMPHRSGKLKSLDKFDAQYFNFSDEHANLNDPLIRLFHEVVFETLIDSGNDPAKLSGKRIGVFVANEGLERHAMLLKNETSVRHNGLMGTWHPILANNISYFFNFKGPSFVLSSGCSAGATALNMAFQNILTGQCESAIVAGCNLALNPLVTLSYNYRRFLSPDGKSKFMDEKADGYAMSEICCALYLERAKSAKRVYSRVLATGVSHDGYKDRRYVPSSDAISDLITETLDKAKVKKTKIRYVECHGAGTKLGDLSEVTAIYNALCADIDRTDPVWLGSIKTNVGHANCGAFLSSLAKVLSCFEHGIIPANLHLDKLLPKFEKMLPKLRHIGNNMAYEQGPYMITSLGLGGSNAVTLLEPSGEIVKADKSQMIDHHGIIPLFSRTQSGIERQISKINQFSSEGKLTSDFIMLIYSIANVQNMPYRGYMLVNNLNIDQAHSFSSHYSVRNEKKQLIFKFSDVNNKIEKYSEKLNQFKSFKELNDKSRKYYQDRNIKLESLEDNDRSFINNVIHVMSMVNMLLSLNVLPDQCIANSLFGQLLCAYVNRDLNDEHILQIAYQITKFNIGVIEIDEKDLAKIIKINSAGHFYDKFFEGEYMNTNLHRNKIENSIIIDFSAIDSKTEINRDITEDCIRLNIFSESDFHTNVLTLLGRLYEWGLDIEWNALYASSGQYPVSRGTQSVVPLLQWDHSKDYVVPKYSNYI